MRRYPRHAWPTDPLTATPPEPARPTAPPMTERREEALGRSVDVVAGPGWRCPALRPAGSAKSLAQRLERCTVLGRGRHPHAPPLVHDLRSGSVDPTALSSLAPIPLRLAKLARAREKGIAVATKPVQFDPGTGGRTARRLLFGILLAPRRHHLVRLHADAHRCRPRRHPRQARRQRARGAGHPRRHRLGLLQSAHRADRAISHQRAKRGVDPGARRRARTRRVDHLLVARRRQRQRRHRALVPHRAVAGAAPLLAVPPAEPPLARRRLRAQRRARGFQRRGFADGGAGHLRRRQRQARCST